MSIQDKREDFFGIQFINQNEEAWNFENLPVTIGRDPDNDLVLTESTVSGKHAVVLFDETLGAVCIKDQDSRNGLYVNDLPTRMNILVDGDRIRLGEASIVFRDTGYIHN